MSDESPDDLTPYDLAAQVIEGMPRTEAAHREIAAELVRVRTEVQEIALRERDGLDSPGWYMERLRQLARSMGIEVP